MQSTIAVTVVRSRHSWSATWLVLCSFLLASCTSAATALVTALAFVPTYDASKSTRRRHNHRQSEQSDPVSVGAAANNDNEELLPGVKEFESWLSSKDSGAWLDSSVAHDKFDGVRGLRWKGSASSTITFPTKIFSIPARSVLSSDFTKKESWDVDLAVQLWKEYLKDDTTKSGYIKLLSSRTDNDDTVNNDVPPSTAPHSLRRWSKEQKQYLSATSAGQSLIEVEEEQEATWRRKYDAVSTTLSWSWPQFQWAMEAVRSRAFCGLQTEPTSAALVSLSAPIVAASAGYIYTTTSGTSSSNAVLAGLALIAVLPTIVSLMKPAGATCAVLLPLIDSANHWEPADSSIEFNPLSRSFELSIGRNCLVSEKGRNGGDMTQLYVSYGKKTPAELLLNYGFLPGVSVCDNDDEAYRRRLADRFVEQSR